MKIAHLLSSLSRANGGISESVRRLAQTQAQTNGIDVRVFGLRDRFTDEDLPAWQPLQTTCLPVRGPRAFGYAPQLARALAAFDADLSHAAGLWMYPSVAQAGWARRAKRPYVLSPHGMLDPWALRHSAWKKKLASALFEWRHLERAACLHALCEAEADAIRALGLRNPVCVVPNGVDLPSGSAPPRAPWAGRVPAEKRVLLFLGRLHPKKGLRPLLEAWSRVRDPAWHLVAVGWDQVGHRAELEAAARALSIADSVTFLGPLHGAEKGAAYAHAEAFILPSFSEGLPMTVLEAWAHARPTLMTEACNLPEGFAAGAAIRIDARAEPLAEQLREFFARSPEERAAIGLRASALAATRFAWARVAADLLAVYRWICGSGPQPGCVRMP